MAIFKDHRIGVNQLLDVIPEALLSHLSENTKVDYYSKVLHGKKLFYLLMYGILENDRLSQRTLEDTFNDPIFKMLFNLDQSERLSKIDSDFFKQIYECIYDQFSDVYTAVDRQKYNLIRVDSTIVSETCNKLIEGLSHNQSGKNQLSTVLLLMEYYLVFQRCLPLLNMVVRILLCHKW